MKNEPLVSVIVPIYNVAKYLPACIDSILGQTYRNLEIILVDDGAGDGSEKIVDEYAKKDGRVVAIHQKNGGQSRARNVGIDRARGEYISFIDGDDEIAPNFIESLVGKMNGGAGLAVSAIYYRWLRSGNECGVYTNRVRRQRKNESIENYMTFLLVIDGRMYSSVNKLYRAEIIKKNELRFTEKMKFAEDTRFVLSYLKKMKGGIEFILEPLYIYNYGTESSTVRSSSTEWDNWLQSYADVKKFVGKKGGVLTGFWMRMLLLRWRISYMRAKRRAKN